jgi:hypothetical protein
MKPPTAMLIPLLMWDIASSMGTTLFFGTVCSFARKRPATLALGGAGRADACA